MRAPQSIFANTHTFNNNCVWEGSSDGLYSLASFAVHVVDCLHRYW